MGCISSGSMVICGNFAEVLPEKPKDFDYMSDAKWLEPYSMDWRETLGGTICNCKIIEVHYAPYYGFDYYHNDNCNLMRKYRDSPGLSNLYEVYLPAITKYDDAVPNRENIPLYIKNRSRAYKVNVSVKKPQMRLL